MTDMVKVWVLAPGQKGFDANGEAIDLEPGTGRWMPVAEAEAAEREKKVQIMVGLDVSQLRDPMSYRTAAAKAPEKAVATAEAPAPKTTPPAKKPAQTRKKRTYRRRDMTADAPGA